MMWTITYTVLVFHLRYIACAEGDPVGCWPNNVIPFTILPGFTERQRYQIHEAIGQFHHHTCIQWVDVQNMPYNATIEVVFQKMYQYLICQTNTKIRGGKVRVELGDSCFKKNVLVHEMMHVLGFGHEHQRADRDCYVFVDYKEVPLHFHSEYNIKPEPWLERFPYDKQGSTHYPRSVALRARTEEAIPISSRYFEEPLGNQIGELTPLDLWKILFKFCGFPHFCDFFPQMCVFMDEVEKSCAKH